MAAKFDTPAAFLRSEHGWSMHHYQLYPLLGLKAGDHLPLEGIPARLIQGFEVFVKPADPIEYRADGRRIKTSKHRVFVRCTCGRDIPFGRLGQHKKVHNG